MNESIDAKHERRAARVHVWLTNGLQVVMAAGFVLSLYERQWLNAVLIAGIVFLTFLPTLLGNRFQVFIPPEFNMLTIAFIFAALFLGEIQEYYARFWWWDKALHTTSGVLLGILAFVLVYALNQEEHVHLHMKPRFVALFAFTFAVCVGVQWEIFEFAMDSLFGMNMQKSGLVDTMWDLIVDTLGALFVSVLGYVYMSQGRKSFVEDWIMRFIETNPHLFPSRDHDYRI